MEMSDDDRDHVSNLDREYNAKRMKYDHDGQKVSEWFSNYFRIIVVISVCI